MKLYISILLLILPSFIFGQRNLFKDVLLCFESNFVDSMYLNDTISVSVFAFDNSPIEFKRNGKFKRIKAPIVMCGRSRKGNSRIDNLKGTWSLKEDVLSLNTRTKIIELQVVEQTQYTFILRVLSIKNNG